MLESRPGASGGRNVQPDVGGGGENTRTLPMVCDMLG